MVALVGLAIDVVLLVGLDYMIVQERRAAEAHLAGKVAQR